MYEKPRQRPGHPRHWRKPCHVTSSPISSSQAQGSPSTHTGKMSRPKTAAVILGRTECDRVQQLEHEPTRRHNLDSHLPLKRTKPPPWQKNLETPLVPFVVGPGYILSRSKTKCHVTIKDEFFDPVLDDNNRKKTPADSERESLIAQLQQQISDLSLYLEEERLNHRQTKQKAEEFLRDKIDQMSSQHQDYVNEIEGQHRDQMDRLRQEMEDERKEVQTTMERQIGRMAKEIEFLQGAFESYKSTLHSETTEKWNSREEELRYKHAEDKQQALHDMKMRLGHERSQERAMSNKEHHRALELLRKENKREMDNLIRRFSNAAADIERLKKTTAELEETKAELKELRENYDENCRKLTSTTRLLTDTKVRLMDFEGRFQDKVNQIDDKYRHKLQELMTQNTELKRLFIQKCGQLFDEKAQTDNQTSQRVQTAKETMETLIKSRQRANVSIALGGPVEKIRGGKTRPLSAPGTRHETETAHETAGETEAPHEKQEFIPPDITIDSTVEANEMRAELLSTPVRELSKDDVLNSLREY